MSNQPQGKRPNSQSPHASDETIILAKNSLFRRKLNLTTAGALGTTVSRQMISMFIRGVIEHVMLLEDKPVVVGRSDVKTGYHPDVDLTPYGAQEHGVSREHVQLLLHDQHLYVIDMDSANGTFLGGKQLPPKEAQLLSDGDELLLGRLAVQVIFE